MKNFIQGVFIITKKVADFIKNFDFIVVFASIFLAILVFASMLCQASLVIVYTLVACIVPQLLVLGTNINSESINFALLFSPILALLGTLFLSVIHGIKEDGFSIQCSKDYITGLYSTVRNSIGKIAYFFCFGVTLYWALGGFLYDASDFITYPFLLIASIGAIYIVCNLAKKGESHV